jgi:hypothetical protein
MLEWVIECLPSGRVKDTTTTQPATKIMVKRMSFKTSTTMISKVSGLMFITVTALIWKELLVLSNMDSMLSLKESNSMSTTQLLPTWSSFLVAKILTDIQDLTGNSEMFKWVSLKELLWMILTNWMLSSKLLSPYLKRIGTEDMLLDWSKNHKISLEGKLRKNSRLLAEMTRTISLTITVSVVGSNGFSHHNKTPGTWCSELQSILRARIKITRNWVTEFSRLGLGHQKMESSTCPLTLTPT